MQLLLPRASACSEKLLSVAGNAFASGMVLSLEASNRYSDLQNRLLATALGDCVISVAEPLPIDADQITDTDFLAGFVWLLDVRCCVLGLFGFTGESDIDAW